ncbi:glycine zipper 2TM domain-containing protein [Moritella sp.]|uniref:glycine zipper 2TM domain-containing protein n=1 Tax=Moritella sp. TaxID=78556 RepID=UPI0025D81148|nr:glycine zipper 2TM domain-containing protein [Moritella sp.]
MMRLHISTLVVILLITGIETGCVGNPYGDTYAVSDTRQIQHVSYGVIIRAAPVNIEGDKGSSTVGTIAGGAVGGILGSNIGGGSGSDIAAIGGAILGGIAGNKAAQGLTKRHGVKLTIKLDSGKTIAVVQEVNPNMLFRTGQRVQINQQGGTARVVPIN